MFADLRVPVERASVEVLTVDGRRQALVVFQPPGQGLEYFVEAPEPFFPAHEDDRLLLFSRRNVMVLSAPSRGSRFPGEDELPETRRRVRVWLGAGAVLEGEVRWIAYEGASRPIDHLNEPSKSFRLFAESTVHHVVKAHVRFVEEVR